MHMSGLVAVGHPGWSGLPTQAAAGDAVRSTACSRLALGEDRRRSAVRQPCVEARGGEKRTGGSGSSGTVRLG
eukprot:14692764-Alexandrium_andersonii.AAC.1